MYVSLKSIKTGAMGKEFKAFNHGKNQIDIGLSIKKFTIEMKPTELHLKEDGSNDGKPSFLIFMEGEKSNAFGQLSLKMLSETMEELGYLITKK